MSAVDLTIFHYPRCSKSRKALNFIEKQWTGYRVRLLTDIPPTAEEIRLLAQKLKLSIPELVNPSSDEFRKSLKGKNFSEHEWLKIFTENPLLMRRPLVVKGCRAVFAHPPERILELFDINQMHGA
jgi:arsenate reductase (glutaredoxin)